MVALEASGQMDKGKQFVELPEELTASPETMPSTGAPAPEWEKQYGKAFRFAKTPQGAVEGGADPGTVSLVTPENGDAWDSWEAVDDAHLSTIKSRWAHMWNNAGGYKQRQVLKHLGD